MLSTTAQARPQRASRDLPLALLGAMVRATLLGRKRQTRRVLLPQPVLASPHDPFWQWKGARIYSGDDPGSLGRWQKGDRLWIRETWATHTDFDNLKPRELPRDAPVWYAATDYDADDNPDVGRWRRPMFLPRRLARVRVEVDRVRLQPLHDISAEDAIAEGMQHNPDAEPYPWLFDWTSVVRDGKHPDSYYGHATARDAFANLWSRLNGERGYSWSANHWVTATEYHVIENRGTRR